MVIDGKVREFCQPAAAARDLALDTGTRRSYSIFTHHTMAIHDLK